MARASAATARKPITDADRDAAVGRAKAKNTKAAPAAEEPVLELKLIPLESLIPDVDNLRGPVTLENDDQLQSLAESIAQVGIKQALTVHPHPWEDGAYRIEAGARRRAAAEIAGLSVAPCLVGPPSDENRWDTFLAENIHRKGLSAIQIAVGLQHFVDQKMNQRDIAARVGMSQPQVSKLLSLLKLPERAQQWIESGALTQDAGVELAKLPKAVVEELCEGDHAPMDGQINAARNEQDRLKRVADSLKLVEERGLTLVDQEPKEFVPANLIDGEVPPTTLSRNWGTLAHVDVDEHASEPCAAVWVDHQGRVIPVCTNHLAHPKPDPEPGIQVRDVSPLTPSEKAQADAEAALVPTYRKALSVKVDPTLVLPFVARPVLTDDDWDTAERACEFLALDGRTSDPLEDLARLADDCAAGTPLLAYAISNCHGHLLELIRTIVENEGTTLDLIEEQEPGPVAAARSLLDFIRLVCPNDQIGELVDVVTDFAAVEGDGSDDDEAPAEVAESNEGGASLDLDAMVDPTDEDDEVVVVVEEDPPTETGADAPTPSSTDAVDAPAGDGDGSDLPVVTVVKGGRAGAVKYFLDCSTCGRLSGFNTSAGYIEEKAKAHWDEEPHNGIVGTIVNEFRPVSA